MSDEVMLDGVLRMPPESWTNDAMDQNQRYGRYVQAADTLAEQRKRIRELERQLTNVSMFLEGAKIRKRQGQRSLAFEALAVIDEARGPQA